MNTPLGNKCLVLNCKRDADRMWQPDMHGKPEVPVCEHHYRRKLWWYKGWIFDKEEV
jgi:hypothetical protein